MWRMQFKGESSREGIDRALGQPGAQPRSRRLRPRYCPRTGMAVPDISHPRRLGGAVARESKLSLSACGRGLGLFTAWARRTAPRPTLPARGREECHWSHSMVPGSHVVLTLAYLRISSSMAAIGFLSGLALQKACTRVSTLVSSSVFMSTCRPSSSSKAMFAALM